MMRSPLLACSLVLAIALPCAAGQTPARSPEALDLNMSVSTLTAEEVKLVRGALLARHCFRPEDAQLRGEYAEYLRSHCGIDYEFEAYESEAQRKATPPDTSFTTKERAFLHRLDVREAAIRARQTRTTEAGPVYDSLAIVNRSQLALPSAAVFVQLVRDGFVLVPAHHAQLFDVYEENDYALFPNFITVDAALQMYHLYFDFALRHIEQERLLEAARQLSDGMGRSLAARCAAAPAGPRAAALERAALYFAVSSVLALPDSLAAAPVWVRPEWRGILGEQLALISGMEGTHYGPILGTVDYTMFRPRGHYTRNRSLERYFRAMTWLGLPGFILDEKVVPMEATLAMCHALLADPELRARYDLIYEPTTFFVGPTDDLTPMLVWAVADSICGRGAGLERWLDQADAIRAELIRRDPTRIRPQSPDDRALPQVRFMGMRYIVDSEILQRLTFSPKRPRPSGLDIFCVMNAPLAVSLQAQARDIVGDPEVKKAYWQEVEHLRAEYGAFEPAAGDNLYHRWVHLLRTLNQKPPVGAAPFMLAKPWEFKNLSTALASWAQLRHDTILYSKQSEGAECGGGETIPRVVGYVEPRPEVYAEMSALLRATTDELARLGLSTRELGSMSAQIDELLTFLRVTSEQEVAGTSLSDASYERIRIFGAELQNLTQAMLLEFTEDSGTELDNESDRSIATAADVHTRDGATGIFALEECVGEADEVFALVEIEGALYVTRGAVFSYYEFEHPADDRLTDRAWQKMLKEGRAPDRPAWIRRILPRVEAVELPVRYTYSSGC
jgi:hypothetical protein